MKTMKAYKLFRLLKSGEITPLFINKKLRLPIGEWMEAEEHRTMGFAFRPGWHCTNKPIAPHLKEEGRIWMEVEIEGPINQGGMWFLAKRMKIIGTVKGKN